MKKLSLWRRAPAHLRLPRSVPLPQMPRAPVSTQDFQSRDFWLIYLQGAGSLLFCAFVGWFVLGPPTFADALVSRFMSVADKRDQFFYTEAVIPLVFCFVICSLACGLSWPVEGKMARKITLSLFAAMLIPLLAVLAISGFDAVELLVKHR